MYGVTPLQRGFLYAILFSILFIWLPLIIAIVLLGER